MSTKESRELYLVERFLPELFGEQPFVLSQPAPPLPDIVVEMQNKKIGIEMTALILNEKYKQRESEQDVIVREAQKIFEKNSQVPLHVAVSFRDIANWKQLNRKQIAGFVASNVENIVSQISNLFQDRTQFDLRLDDIVHSHVQSISIFYLARLTMPCWSTLTSFWVPNLPIKKIQDIINRKSQNIAGYLEGCDEVWLLILEIGSQSSYFEHFEKLKKITFTSSFARTLIGRISKCELLKLKTEI